MHDPRFGVVCASLAALASWGVLGAGGCSHAQAPSAVSTVDATDGVAASDAGGCAEGFVPLDDAQGCEPILPPEPCEAGAGPIVGSSACAPVGATACAPGFVTHASGWGCDAVIPQTACTGATIDTLGSEACAPVGDCNAAFPPANATLFVSASYSASQLDATHFQAIDLALANAPNGAVIAVDLGTYTGQIAPTLDASVVGRCASGVVLQGNGSSTSAIEIQGGQVSISNLTVTGYHGALSLLGGATTLDDVVVDGNAYVGIAVGNPGTSATLQHVVVRGTRMGPTDTNGFGLYIGYAAKVTVTGSVFEDNDYVNVGISGAATPGASLSMSGSIVRDGHPPSASLGFGWGVYASAATTLTIDSSAIVDNQGIGLSLYGTTPKDAPSAKVTSSIVRGTALDTVSGAGFGFETTQSTADVEQSTFADSAVGDVYFADGSTATLSDCALVGTSSADPTVLGPLGLIVLNASAKVTSVAIAGTRAGASIQGSSKVDIQGSLATQTKTSPLGLYVDDQYVGLGLFTESASRVSIESSSIVGAHSAGILALGQLTASGLLVSGTQAGGDMVGGRGLSAQAGARVDIVGSAFIDNVEVGALAALDGTTLALDGCLVDHTGLDPSGHYGFGLLWASTAIGALSGTTVRGSAGPAIAVDDGSGTVASCVVEDNAIGVFVQDGTTLVQGAEADAGAGLTLDISSDTAFVGNQTKVGSGVIAVPMPLMTP